MVKAASFVLINSFKPTLKYWMLNIISLLTYNFFFFYIIVEFFQTNIIFVKNKYMYIFKISMQSEMWFLCIVLKNLLNNNPKILFQVL